MPQTETMPLHDTPSLTEAAVSRRALLTAGAGLAGVAAIASSSAQAQAPAAAPQMPPVQAPVRQEWPAKRTEQILEPGLPIVDPHHHLWDAPRYRYMFPELLADLGSGHNIVATMYEQAREMYRPDGPEELKSLGETEFITGVAAMSASGKYGPTKCIAGITGFVDLRLGSRAKGVIERHISVSDGRLRAIRNGSTWSEDPVLKPMSSGMPQGLLLDKTFREGVATLAGLNLAFDAWMFQTQLGDLVDLARAFPQTTIVLNHVGGPVAIGPYAGKRDEAFKEWRGLIQQIAAFPNTYVKLGGLGMRMIGFDFFNNAEPPASEDLAKAWKPYIETCIAAFGRNARCSRAISRSTRAPAAIRCCGTRSSAWLPGIPLTRRPRCSAARQKKPIDSRYKPGLVADVAGYLPLMSADEEGTFATLKTLLREAD
jgi:predicted TIM-barrel fold metal-dependent hydrolase